MSDLPPSVLPIRLPVWLAWSEPVLLRLFAWRYFRFATVGASGTVVNIAVLYVMQAVSYTHLTLPTNREV